MRIDCGTTTEHRVRLGIFLVMCIVFAGYFGYDGLWGYPAKNLEWAKQNIPISPAQKDGIKTNPRVMLPEVDKLAKLANSASGLTEEQLHAALGEPAIVVPDATSYTRDAWYVGPAACVRIKLVGAKIEEIAPLQNINKSEEDIKMQKVFGVGLGIVAVVMGLYYIRIMTMRTVLDEEGVAVKGRRVAWDEMRSLDTSDYQRKGWLDLVYSRDGRDGSVRMDSYHINQFDAIINAICDRKGFETPIKPRAMAEETAEDEVNI